MAKSVASDPLGQRRLSPGLCQRALYHRLVQVVSGRRPEPFVSADPPSRKHELPQPVRSRVRPRWPCSDGIASTRARASCESARLALVRRTASGTPSPSQIRCRLPPLLARSGDSALFAFRHRQRARNKGPRWPRDQSMSPSRGSQFRRAKCNRSQMHSCRQSRKRRQHVIPDPQPSSRGNICHGMPLRSTRGCQ
jgi:hypothetical protein